MPSRFPDSRQVGAPTVPGRSGPFWLSFGDVLEDTERCSNILLWPDRSMSSWRKSVPKIFDIGRLGGAISVSGEARTVWTHPGSWGILWRSLLMDYIEVER